MDIENKVEVADSTIITDTKTRGNESKNRISRRAQRASEALIVVVAGAARVAVGRTEAVRMMSKCDGRSLCGAVDAAARNRYSTLQFIFNLFSHTHT